MQKETVTFDKLPEAVGYLTEQVIELKKMVAELQPQPSDKHVLVEIEDACRIIRKAKPTIYTLVRKGLLPAYKKGKKLYFYEDELLSWIENGRRKSAEQTSLFCTLSTPVLNPRKKFVFIEIEFLTFLIGRKQSFAYQCINGRLGFSDDTASILYFYQHMFVRWLWLEFRYHLFQLDDLFGQITYRFGQLIKCYCFFLHTPIVFNCSMA